MNWKHNKENNTHSCKLSIFKFIIQKNELSTSKIKFQMEIFVISPFDEVLLKRVESNEINELKNRADKFVNKIGEYLRDTQI